MIKNGKVILNNDACIVVDVDGVEVQLPPVKISSQIIQLDCTDGVYSLIGDAEHPVGGEIVAEVEETPAEETKKKRKRSRKKDSESNDTVE